MSTVDPHPLPGMGAISREQFRTVGHALRPLALAVAGFLLFITWVIWDTAGETSPTTLVPYVIGLPAAVLAMLVPPLLWRNETPARRGYLFSLPVERSRHLLLKNVAGWGWAMAGTAVLYLYAVLAAGVTAATIGDFAPWQWASPFVVATAAYLLTATAATAFNYPAWWIVGGYFAFLSMIRTHAARVIVAGEYGAAALLGGIPEMTHRTTIGDWLIACALWVGIGAAALYLASTIRREP